MSGLVVLIDLVLGAASLAVLLPASVFFLEIPWSLSDERNPVTLHGERPRLTVLVPAHNGAILIARTIRSIAPQLKTSNQLLVIADNCSDQTAKVAAEAGANVIVRTDLARRGKGYALDYGVRHLERNPPDVVIIVDADCQVEGGAVDRIARLCAETSRPVQALYLMRAAEGAPLKMRLAEFAWIVKNQVRPRGLHMLGLPCQLMGTGMAFPWSLIRAADLASGHIVEDMKLGVDLARAGAAPLFCPEALVTSEFPTSASGAEGQRTRWEHGHLSVIVSEAPRLLLEALKRRDVKLMAMACDLSVPPLALLVLMVAALWVLSLVCLLLAQQRFALIVASVAVALIVSSAFLAWARCGRQLVSPRELAIAVMYPLWKIPLYVKFLVARQMTWVRSKRDGEEP